MAKDDSILKVDSLSHSSFKPTLPQTLPAGMKASCLMWPKKMPHKYKNLGVVVLHDPKATISFNEFDFRYRGKRSRLGRYLRELHALGVDVDGLIDNENKSLENEELTIHIAKRLYEALVKRTIYEDKTARGSIKLTTKKAETWDWKKPAARKSRYYKMAELILKESDPETALRIVNIITGYA